MYQWKLAPIDLDLKFTWKIARASTQKKRNYIINVSDGFLNATGEVAGITTDLAQKQYIENSFSKINHQDIKNIDDILKLKIPPSLKFAMESALTHLLSQKDQTPIWKFLKQEKPLPLETSFSIPIMPTKEIGPFIHKYNLTRFSSLKIKIDQNGSMEHISEIQKHFKGPLRIDANEAFESFNTLSPLLKTLEKIDIDFLEQPFPRTKTKEFKKLKQKTNIPIIADESLQDNDIPRDMNQYFDGINIKLMKAGSYTQAIKQIEQAQNFNLKIMLGCMVETSLGIHSAALISNKAQWIDLDGFLFFEDEPFGKVTEKNGKLYFP